jgi:hypothetical protein
MDSKTVSRVVGRKGDLRAAIVIGFEGLPVDAPRVEVEERVEVDVEEEDCF